MLVIFLLFVFVFRLFSAFSFDRGLDASWKEYQVKFNKTYELSEESYRRKIWEANVVRIGRHNLEANLGIHYFYLQVNKFADMSPDELDNYRKCVFAGSNNASFSYLKTTVSCDTNCSKSLPSQVDWRTKGYVTPVKNQGACGSCWAFSATGALEALTAKKGKLENLSEQNLVDCSHKQGNKGCNGGWMDYAFQYVIDKKGIDTEESYNYTGKKEKCKFQRVNVGAKCSYYRRVKEGSEDSLKYAVANNGPISVAIDAGNFKFLYYESGIYYDTECSTSSLDHAVLVVGYGSEDGADYWIVKNSWGETWGMKGYILMSRNQNNQCGIASHAVFPLV